VRHCPETVLLERHAVKVEVANVPFWGMVFATPRLALFFSAPRISCAQTLRITANTSVRSKFCMTLRSRQMFLERALVFHHDSRRNLPSNFRPACLSLLNPRQPIAGNPKIALLLARCCRNHVLLCVPDGLNGESSVDEGSEKPRTSGGRRIFATK
jgi:hypothetical protein